MAIHKIAKSNLEQNCVLSAAIDNVKRMLRLNCR